MALKFKVIGSRTVNGAEPGSTFEIEEDAARPGDGGTNVPALLLSDLVEPANASTRKWCASLEGSQFASKYGVTEEPKGDTKTNG